MNLSINSEDIIQIAIGAFALAVPIIAIKRLILNTMASINGSYCS